MVSNKSTQCVTTNTHGFFNNYNKYKIPTNCNDTINLNYVYLGMLHCSYWSDSKVIKNLYDVRLCNSKYLSPLWDSKKMTAFIVTEINKFLFHHCYTINPVIFLLLEFGALFPSSICCFYWQQFEGRKKRGP